jgi:hypothetical protein
LLAVKTGSQNLTLPATYLDDLAKMPLQASIFASWYNKGVNFFRRKKPQAIACSLSKLILPVI